MSGLSEDDLHRRYQVILSNPPFAGQIPKESVRADLPTKSKKSERLFLSLMMQNDIPGLLAAWADYKVSRFEKPPGVEAGSILEPGSEEPRCWWATFEMLAESDFNLTASRYEPRVGEQAPDEDPAELVREVLAIEQEITDGLEKLLTEIEA
jgi:hypothetical protein